MLMVMKHIWGNFRWLVDQFNHSLSSYKIDQFQKNPEAWVSLHSVVSWQGCNMLYGTPCNIVMEIPLFLSARVGKMK